MTVISKGYKIISKSYVAPPKNKQICGHPGTGTDLPVTARNSSWSRAESVKPSREGTFDPSHEQQQCSFQAKRLMDLKLTVSRCRLSISCRTDTPNPPLRNLPLSLTHLKNYNEKTLASG